MIIVKRVNIESPGKDMTGDRSQEGRLDAELNGHGDCECRWSDV